MTEASTLPDLPDLSVERRNHALRTVALALVALFVLAGLANLYGVQSRTTSARSPSGLEAEVRYASRSRPGLATPFEVTIRSPDGFDGPIDVVLTSSYLAAFDQNAITPQPAEEVAEEGRTVWTFDPPEGEELKVTLDARLEPGVQWRRRGTVRVVAQEERLDLPITTWVLP